jgi:hypothetical protein
MSRSIALEKMRMNEMTAAEGSKEESTDAQDFVEMGTVSEETKGGNWGNIWDGGVGRWTG